MDIIDFSFGKLYLHDYYCHLDLLDSAYLSLNDCKDVIKEINLYFNKRPHVVISDRKFTASIDIEAYKHVNHKRMIGIAIVSSNPDIKEELAQEQKIYKGSFAFFPTVNQAKDWAESFVQKYD